MSFFDEDDEPRQTPRPRRVRGLLVVARATTDNQTLLIRRAVALVGGILVLLLLIIAVNSCRNSQQENALKDYNRELSTIAAESAQQVSTPFFQTLTEGSGSAQDLQTQISSFRVQAEQQYDRAAALDVPGEMKGAQQAALIALEWRRDGLDKIAQEIRTALGDEGEAADAAIDAIAGQMEVFAASDVAWDTRVIPFIKNALDENEIGGQEIRRSPFLPDGDWIQATTVADVLNQQLTSGGGEGGGQPTGPGLHGSGLDSTTYGETTLQPGTTNRLTFDPGTGFVVSFTNQGENDEFDIKVTLRIQTEDGDPIVLSDTIPRLAPQESASAELALEDTPPLDTAVTIRVSVAKVPGEEKVDNNRSEYPALFSRG